MVASGFRVWHLCPFGKSVICFSSDEGKTWSLPAIWKDTPLDDRDTGITAFGESSVILTGFTVSGEKSSQFMGKKVQEKVHAYGASYLELIKEKMNPEKYEGSSFRISHDNGQTFGELKYLPVTCPHGPAALPDGTLLYVGNTYKNGWKEKHAQCYKLYPDGNYEFLCDIESNEDGIANDEPYAIALKSGKILVHFRKRLGADPFDISIYQSESYDGGRSFTKSHSIGLDKNSGAPPHIIEQDGVLISLYGHRERGNWQIRAAFSFDEGETWDGDHVITGHQEWAADFGYPSSVVLQDGSILTVYYATDEGRSGDRFYEDENGVVENFPATVVKQVIWRYETGEVPNEN